MRVPGHSSGEYCEKRLADRALHWQYDAFCPESPEYLPEFSPPFYELNPDTHRPFANILRMRSAKIKNFRNMQAWMPNVAHVRFEELLADGGQVGSWGCAWHGARLRRLPEPPASLPVAPVGALQMKPRVQSNLLTPVSPSLLLFTQIPVFFLYDFVP